MPFVDAGRHDLDRVDVKLLQLGPIPASRTAFQLVEPLYWLDRNVASEPLQIVEPHCDSRTTDLASVPWFLWGLIASYGLHTPAALLHDQQCEKARCPKSWEARREADERFLAALTYLKVNGLRSLLMYAAVSIGRYKEFRRGSFALLFVHLVLAAALVSVCVVGVAGWFPLGSTVDFPLLDPIMVTRTQLLVTLFVPTLGALAWWRDWRAISAGSYAAAILAPAAILVLLTAVIMFALGFLTDPSGTHTFRPTRLDL